jgi:hypothetical protein
MKYELRVFKDDRAAPVHTEEVVTENPLRNAHDLAFKFGLGAPVFPMVDGFRFSEGYVYTYPLEDK